MCRASDDERLQLDSFLKKIFHEILKHKAISLAEIGVTLKATSVATNETASFRFSRKFILKMKLTLRLHDIVFKG